MGFSKPAKTNLILETNGSFTTSFKANFKDSALAVQFLSKKEFEHTVTLFAEADLFCYGYCYYL